MIYLNPVKPFALQKKNLKDFYLTGCSNFLFTNVHKNLAC